MYGDQLLVLYSQLQPSLAAFLTSLFTKLLHLPSHDSAPTPVGEPPFSLRTSPDLLTLVPLASAAAVSKRNNVMEIVSLGAPSTPVRAISAGPSPPRRDSMDDSDPSLTRKRPRLDSGDRSYRSMSADELANTPSRNLLRHSPSTPARYMNVSNRDDEATVLASASGTPSKVTINVKEPLPTNSPPGPTMSSTELDTMRAELAPSEASTVEVPLVVDASSPEIISVSSSPSRSPEIEVAEIEDMSEAPSETRWRCLSEATELQRTLLRAFPFASRNRHPRQAIDAIIMAFDNDDFPHEARPFKLISSWIEDYLEATESKSSRWSDMYLDQQEFWESLPNILMVLVKRSEKANFGNVMTRILRYNRDVDHRQDLEDLLVAFAALTTRMVKLDCQALEDMAEETNVQTEFASQAYLRCLAFFSYQHAVPFWTTLHRSHDYDYHTTITATTLRFVEAPGNGFQYLTRLLILALSRSTSPQDLAPRSFYPLQLVNRIMEHYVSLKGIDEPLAKTLLDTMVQLPTKAYQLFQAVDPVYQQLITKQVAALNGDVNRDLVSNLSCLLSSVARADERLQASMSQNYPTITDALYGPHGSVVALLTWKLLVFRKCLMEGRMELRVQGVDSMQQELVSVYKTYMNRELGQYENALAQHVAELLLANKFVEYLVGVESHPKLINQSANIVGFLIITRRYRATETDAIWRTVTLSQDSRTVDAILTMLNGFINLADYDTLLYLTSKLSELPLLSYDQSMLDYGVHLLLALQQHWKTLGSDSKLDLPPYYLCIRLIREAATDDSLVAERKRALNVFGTQQLRLILHLGPNEADRNTIYENCVRDIRSRSQFSTGSISAIHALLGQNAREEVIRLANDFDLTRLVVGELSYQSAKERFSNTNPDAIDELLIPRLGLLEAIIIYAPDSLDIENGKRLWDSILSRPSLHEVVRDRALIMLVQAIRTCSTRNSFIDKCITIYLPELDPALFATRHSLSFVEQIIYYESRLARLTRDDEEQYVAPSGTTLLWRFASVVPSGTVELEAIHRLVALYLDSPKAKDSPRVAMEASYVEVVDRCISQLSLAATALKGFTDGTSSGEDEPMIVVASEEEIQAHKLSFSRSLLILKEFVHGARSRPMYSPPQETIAQLPSETQALSGLPLRLKYQAFSGGLNSGINSIEAGDLESISDLSQRLVERTGFWKFTVIASGERLDLQEEPGRTLRDIKIDQKGLLIVRKVHDDSAAPDITPVSKPMPLQGEIMKHFAKLHPLLGVEDALANKVFDFLVTFPPDESVTGPVCAPESPIEDVFPRQSPFKILYSVYALKHCLLHQLRNGTASQKFISHGVRLLATVLTTYDIVGASVQTEVDLLIAGGLVDCLLAFLKEPTSAELSSNYIADAAAFVERLTSCLFSAQSLGATYLSGNLVLNCFAVLLESSLHCRSVWEHFQVAGRCTVLLRTILLEDMRWEIRQGVTDRLKSIFSVLPTLNTSTSEELGPFFWHHISTLFSQSLAYPENSQQLFDVAQVVFRSLDHLNRESFEMQTNVEEWSHILLSHRSIESIGSDKTDWVVHGLSSLLQLCMQLAKSFKKPMQTNNLMETLFKTFLFPPISTAPDDDRIDYRIPILNSRTRQTLYSIVLALNTDLTEYERLLDLVKGLLPEGEDPQAWSWGIAQLSEEYPYEANWNLERDKLIRSPTGYPGMRNLSNTCYMNSLFTQLFMNIGFRAFILNANIADGEEQQKLLSETKTLFAYMQETLLKSVDPQAISDSINTYDNSPVDVSIQMDVDEFYNLLFDRCESQILSDADKKRFRSFYGGQIVQQIKSKECPHISERLEPFSAIQCDIQGKRSLAESLDAYVAGEVMEGDNKYSCTSCGSYVNAEKRACLKDIPDNLIFHLKRFDYDVGSGLRSKINDRFEFPSEIDMAPYHVDTLKDPKHPSTPDVFELVGVLVHSGTAESGHYYSYIRERPVTPSQSRTWVEYNDADLTRFDPSNIPDQCFGGEVEQPPFKYHKQWNAYCLFYQRRESILADLRAYQPSIVGMPVKTELATDLYNRIATNNEIFIRKYCLLDPAHASFAKSLLEQLRYFKKDTCSDSHHIEKEAIWLALEHLNQVFSRAKDSLGFHDMIESLERTVNTCAACCKIALDWLTLHERNVRTMLLRCPSPKVREEFAALIANALLFLRNNNKQAYGLVDEDMPASISDAPLSDVSGSLSRIVQSLKDLRCHTPSNSKAWDDYYVLLTTIAQFGSAEARLLLREGFLATCLGYLIVEHHEAKEPLRRKNSYYGTYLRLLDRGRKYSLHKLIDLVRILLEHVNIAEEPVTLEEGDDRPVVEGKAVLSAEEDELIRFGAEVQRPKSLVFLEKILSVDQNRAAAKSIVRMLVLAEPCTQMLSLIQKTITNGVNIDPATLAAPYLDAALVYCEACPYPNNAREVIKHIALEVDTIGANGGSEHLEFFTRARRLTNIRITRNAAFFTRQVLLNVPHWAPALLMYWEESVRHDTIELLHSLVFGRDTQNMDNEAEAEQIEKTARELCMACVRRVDSAVIQEHKPVDTRQVENVDRVITYCIQKYCQDEENRPLSVIAEAALDSLRALAVSDVDDVISEAWNNDISDNVSDSDSSGVN